MHYGGPIGGHNTWHVGTGGLSSQLGRFFCSPFSDFCRTALQNQTSERPSWPKRRLVLILNGAVHRDLKMKVSPIVLLSGALDAPHHIT
jgi:hypothetical protein